jgi:hypothetical protein|tara:strand:+ start:1110 stop:1811 length:702 start_codon:yes stop_codon:yes gene_type:complete
MPITNYDLTIDSATVSDRVFPTTVKPVQIEVSIEQATLTSTTNALTTQRRSLGAHRIQLEYTYSPMTADEMQPFIAFFSAMQGNAKAFKLNVPKELINDTTHIADGIVHNVLIEGSSTGAVGQRVIRASAFGADLTGGPGATSPAIKGGNFIQFSSHDKIYIVAENGGSDGDGDCVIRFEPALLTAVTASHRLNDFDEDIPLHAIFKNNTFDFDVNSALHYGFKINFIEQWTG